MVKFGDKGSNSDRPEDRYSPAELQSIQDIQDLTSFSFPQAAQQFLENQALNTLRSDINQLLDQSICRLSDPELKKLVFDIQRAVAIEIKTKLAEESSIEWPVVALMHAFNITTLPIGNRGDPKLAVGEMEETQVDLVYNPTLFIAALIQTAEIQKRDQKDSLDTSLDTLCDGLKSIDSLDVFTVVETAHQFSFVNILSSEVLEWGLVGKWYEALLSDIVQSDPAISEEAKHNRLLAELRQEIEVDQILFNQSQVVAPKIDFTQSYDEYKTQGQLENIDVQKLLATAVVVKYCSSENQNADTAVIEIAESLQREKERRDEVAQKAPMPALLSYFDDNIERRQYALKIVKDHKDYLNDFFRR